MLLAYFLLFHIYGVFSKNLLVNNRIPVDLDIALHVSGNIKVTVSPTLRSRIFNIRPSDRDHIRIGNVYENGILIYPDSDILIYRKVIKLIETEFNGTIIQINSIYNNGYKEISEIVEFIRTAEGGTFKEVVRRPVLLDLKPGSDKLTPIEIRRNYRIINNDELVDYTKELTIFDIKQFERLSFVLGLIKYGNILIDSEFYTITYKGVNVYRNELNELIVKIYKMVKNGNYVTTECVITFDDEEEKEGSCRPLTTKTEVLI